MAPTSTPPSLSAEDAAPRRDLARYVIVMGDAFADESPRRRQERVRALLRRALGAPGLVYE